MLALVVLAEIFCAVPVEVSVRFSVSGFAKIARWLSSTYLSSHDVVPPPSPFPSSFRLPDHIASQRYEVPVRDADARENAEAVTAIDDFLERSQDVVGSGINNGDAAEPLEGDDADGASRGDGGGGPAATAAAGEGPARRGDGEGLKRPDRWVGAPRWSRNRET